MKTEFALDLRLARRKAGLTQRDCAHLLDVHPVTISNLEKGKRAPSLDQVCALALIYGRSFQSLFNEITERSRKDLQDRLATLPKEPVRWLGSFNRNRHLDRLEDRLAASEDGYGAA